MLYVPDEWKHVYNYFPWKCKRKNHISNIFYFQDIMSLFAICKSAINKVSKYKLRNKVDRDKFKDIVKVSKTFLKSTV